LTRNSKARNKCSASASIAGRQIQNLEVEITAKGRQITVVVGSSPGGGYDIYARLMARHMGKYIPGNPTLVVTNMPGAGSNAAVAHVYNVAPKDGTFIVAPQNSAVMDALFDAVLGTNRRLRHDATKLIQLGSATTDHYVCIGRSDAPIKTFKQVLTEYSKAPAVTRERCGEDRQPRSFAPVASDDAEWR
jgi:tripartite-type tricarboxylate transporter receptor subunit TctC